MNTAETKIRSTLEKAAQYHRDEDLSPNDAIIKAASENFLNPQMVERVIEGFNIAKTNAVLSRANDKTASFPVAERDPILHGIFGQGITKPANETKTASSEDDTFTEVGMESVPFSFSGMSKTAEPARAELESHVISKMIKDGIGGLLELEGDLSKFAQETTLTESDMARCMRNIGEYFILTENIGKFAEFEADVLSERGPEAKPTLDVVHRHFCPSQPRCDFMPKLGTRSYQATEAHDNFEQLCDFTDEFITKETHLANMRAEFIAKRAEFDGLIKEATGIYPDPPPGAADFFGAGGETIRPIRKTGHQIVDGSAASFIAAPFTPIPKTAGGISDDVRNLVTSPATAITSGLTGAITKSVGDNYDKANQIDVDGPAADTRNEMENVRRTTILRELMAHDEIISRHKPEDVSRVYNTMLSIAPNVTLFPGVVQSVLRSSLEQQAVDPYTAKQFADLEGQHLKNKAPVKA